MDPCEYFFEQNMSPSAECISSLITVEREQKYYQFGQGQASYPSLETTLETLQIIEGHDEVKVQQDSPAGTMIHGGPEIAGTYAAQQNIRVGTMHGGPEIRGTYGIQQGQQAYNQIDQGQNFFWTTEASKQFYYPFGQGQASCTPVATTLEAEIEVPLGKMNGEPAIGGSGTQGDVVSDPHYEARPCRKVIPRTRVLNLENENILPCKSGSDANNLKGKAVSGSLAQKERKRLTDLKHRRKVKAQNQKLRDDFESASKEIDKLKKENDELKEKLHLIEKELLRLKNQDQRNVSSKRKAVFELNAEKKAEAMKMVFGLPDMVNITLEEKKRRLKLIGSFDVEAVGQKLEMCCDAHLVSWEDVSATPGPSTNSSLGISAVQLG